MLLEASGDEQKPFFEQMKGEFEAILRTVDTFNHERAEMEATAKGLEETIGRMEAAISQIRETEIQIQRIAINAAIGAIHIGSSGHALSQVAEVMQALAQDSNAKTEGAALALEGISAAMQLVSGASPDALPSSGVTANDPIQQMRTALNELESSSTSSFARVHEIAVAGARLSDEISALRDSLSAGRLFDRVVTQARQEVDRILTEAGPAATEALRSPDGNPADDLRGAIPCRESVRFTRPCSRPLTAPRPQGKRPRRWFRMLIIWTTSSFFNFGTDLRNCSRNLTGKL